MLVYLFVTMAGAKRWGNEQRAECNKQFDLFARSGGKQGWNPNKTDEQYVKDVCRTNDILRPFLHANLGGNKGNRDSEKAIGGYGRAAGEFFVMYASQGVRRKDFMLATNQGLKPPPGPDQPGPRPDPAPGPAPAPAPAPAPPDPPVSPPPAPTTTTTSYRGIRFPWPSVQQQST